MSTCTHEELHTDRIDRGNGFSASRFVQHEIYREAVDIVDGKLSVGSDGSCSLPADR